MTSGKIVKVVDKGFGFIQPDEAGAKDIFFHVSGMLNRADFDGLAIGQSVEYVVDTESSERPRAVEVRKK